MLNTLDFITSHPLTRDAKLKALMRFIAWQFKSRIRETVIVDWIEETRLSARRGMAGATGNIYVGLHEFADMAFMLHLLQPGDVFCDVGANVGSYTVLASGVCGATTWAFEPDPDTARSLRENLHVNELAGAVRVCELVLGASNGEVRFSVGLDAVNHVVTNGEVKTRTVTQRKLDDVLGENVPLLIKLDVEGYEEQVLLGAQNILRSEGLVAIETERFDEAVRSIVSGHGFEPYYYDPFVRQLSRHDFGYRPHNTLLVRNFEFVQDRLRRARKITVLDRQL